MSIYYSKCTSTPFSIISPIVHACTYELTLFFIFHLSPWLYQLVVIPSDPSQIFFIEKYCINFLRLRVWWRLCQVHSPTTAASHLAMRPFTGSRTHTDVRGDSKVTFLFGSSTTTSSIYLPRLLHHHPFVLGKACPLYTPYNCFPHGTLKNWASWKVCLMWDIGG